MVLKLYAITDGPPSLWVLQGLKALNLPFEYIKMDYGTGQHMTEDYAKMNPQKEIPVLDDDGFYLSKSNAILQYLCDKYKPDSPLYPKDPQARAIVNQRLCFNLSTYYNNICMYAIAPIFFDYERTAHGLKMVHLALETLERYFNQLGTSHVAANHLTIADFPLFIATMCLEVIDFDLSKYPKINKWYNEFKKNYPDLWKIAEEGLKMLKDFEVNRPDLSHFGEHPLHPIRKKK